MKYRHGHGSAIMNVLVIHMCIKIDITTSSDSFGSMGNPLLSTARNLIAPPACI